MFVEMPLLACLMRDMLQILKTTSPKQIMRSLNIIQLSTRDSEREITKKDEGFINLYVVIGRMSESNPFYLTTVVIFFYNFVHVQNLLTRRVRRKLLSVTLM